MSTPAYTPHGVWHTLPLRVRHAPVRTADADATKTDEFRRVGLCELSQQQSARVSNSVVNKPVDDAHDTEKLNIDVLGEGGRYDCVLSTV